VFRVPAALGLLFVIACNHRAPTSGNLVDDAGVAASLSTPPRRIVSLIPVTTELVFALGAGARLVGRTRWCDYPPEAARVPDLGDGIAPNLEAVLGARPDLVLIYRSGANRAAAGRLRQIGIPVLELTTDRIEDLARITRLLGRGLGIEARAESLVAAVEADLASATRAAGPAAGRPTVFLLAWTRPPLTLGRGSFLSEVVERAGARNLFDDLSVPSGPVSVEAVAARDPDWILTSSPGLPAVARQEEWQVVRAVRERRFLRVEGSEFNRPSPRIGGAVRRLAAALDSASR